jgi:hypothetical protein
MNNNTLKYIWLVPQEENNNLMPIFNKNTITDIIACGIYSIVGIILMRTIYLGSLLNLCKLIKPETLIALFIGICYTIYFIIMSRKILNIIEQLYARELKTNQDKLRDAMNKIDAKFVEFESKLLTEIDNVDDSVNKSPVNIDIAADADAYNEIWFLQEEKNDGHKVVKSSKMM